MNIRNSNWSLAQNPSLGNTVHHKKLREALTNIDEATKTN
jgi:hypothetical protein